MTSKTRLLVIFYSLKKEEKLFERPLKLYAEYIEKIHDPDIRKMHILNDLKAHCPDVEFVGGNIISDFADLAGEIKKYPDVDGVLFYILTFVFRRPWFFREEEIDVETLKKYPMIVVFDPMQFVSGLSFFEFNDLLREKRIKAIPIFSFDFNDVIKRINLIKALHKMKESKILYIGGEEVIWDHLYWSKERKSEYLKAVKDVFGTDIVTMGYDKVNEYYKRVRDEDAKALAKQWIENAVTTIGISEDEIIRDAKMYYALKMAMQEVGADAITIDCIKALFFIGQALLPAFPCLALAQLNNEGYTAVCEADINAVITQLLMRHISGKPGFISDVTLDTSSNQAFYWHCICPTKMYGEEAPHLPYIIRKTHVGEGIALQVLAPAGQIITAAKFNVPERTLAIQRGKIIGNEHHIGCSCRTEWVAETNSKKLLEKRVYRLFGSHRVVFFGDYRDELLDIAKLIGFRVIEEDKE